MRWIHPQEWFVVLAAFGAVGSTQLWSADKTAPGDAAEIVQVKAESSEGSTPIVQTGFASPSDLRNTVIDNCEDLGMPGTPIRPFRHGFGAIGRSHQTVRQRIHCHDGNVKGWFMYIRGYGPADWNWR